MLIDEIPCIRASVHPCITPFRVAVCSFMVSRKQYTLVFLQPTTTMEHWPEVTFVSPPTAEICMGKGGLGSSADLFHFNEHSQRLFHHLLGTRPYTDDEGSTPDQSDGAEYRDHAGPTSSNMGPSTFSISSDNSKVPTLNHLVNSSHHYTAPGISSVISLDVNPDDVASTSSPSDPVAVVELTKADQQNRNDGSESIVRILRNRLSEENASEEDEVDEREECNFDPYVHF